MIENKFLIKNSGSSGRTRTYNPSVNSCGEANFYRLLRLTLNCAGPCVHAGSMRLATTLDDPGLLPRVPGIFPGTLGPPPVPFARIAKPSGSPAREGGLVLASSHTIRNLNISCKLSRYRRQAVRGDPYPPAPQHRSQPPAIRSTARQRYNPFSNSESVVPRAEAILLRVRNPGSRVPRSRSEMWTSWTPECSARSICRQPLARRSFRMRSPVAAQMSFAMRP